MSAVAKMLDKVREACSLPSDAALGARLAVTRQTIHCWRHGTAYPSEDHIARLAAMAHEEAGEWLLQVKAESSTGAAAKAWAGLARKLASAAALVLLVGAAALPSPAAAREASNVYYVKFLRLLRMAHSPRLGLTPLPV